MEEYFGWISQAILIYQAFQYICQAWFHVDFYDGILVQVVEEH